MSCDEMSELLPMYIGGGLEQSERSKIAVHMYVCAECRHEAAQLLKIKAAQKSLLAELPAKVGACAFRTVKNDIAEKEAQRQSSAFTALSEAVGVTRSAIGLMYRLIKI